MILRKYKTIIKDEIDRVLNDNKYPKIEYQIKEIANPEFGQLYTNIPFILSRIIKKNPIDIANNIGKNIKFSNAINVSISKPGYLNFKIDGSMMYPILNSIPKQIFLNKTDTTSMSQLSIIQDHSNRYYDTSVALKTYLRKDVNVLVQGESKSIYENNYI